MTLADTIGLLGVAAYVAAHYAVQVRRQSATGRRVMWLNIIGPVCILISMIDGFNLASFMSQCFWLGLTLIGAFKRGSEAKRLKSAPARAPADSTR